MFEGAHSPLERSLVAILFPDGGWKKPAETRGVAATLGEVTPRLAEAIIPPIARPIALNMNQRRRITRFNIRALLGQGARTPGRHLPYSLPWLLPSSHGLLTRASASSTPPAPPSVRICAPVVPSEQRAQQNGVELTHVIQPAAACPVTEG